ncbi:hypothetical protein PTKIN_Ptkin02bG0255400 [Pterospermum kingtungense]
MASLLIFNISGDYSRVDQFSAARNYHDQMRQLQAFKASLIGAKLVSSGSPISLSPSPLPSLQVICRTSSAAVDRVTENGADPTGKSDSTEALNKAIADAFQGPSEGSLIEGINNLGGAEINLEGGNYLISKPLRLLAAGVGNLMIHGGTLRATDDFPTDGSLLICRHHQLAPVKKTIRKKAP